MQKEEKTPKTTPRTTEPLAHQANDAVTIHEIPLVRYDVPALDNFFNVVFHTLPSKAACIMGWKVNVGSHPMMPLTDGHLLDALENTRKPYALYFGTSTCAPDPIKRAPRNRAALFEALHVVVLDDIGTKVQVETLPDDFAPSYIIETSAGNFQYGYVLAEPITDHAAATALIQLIYDAGFSDNGGKMATKIVRLPDGINGKLGEKRDFKCRLVELNDTRWTPDQILTVLEIPVLWSDVEADVSILNRHKDASKLGASPWSPIVASAATMEGITDPVLEWLYDQGLVKNDVCDWVNIQCPNAACHTTGDDLAGYKPIGRGEMPKRRAFNCFHDACATYGTMDFLHYIATNSGIEAGASDEAAYLTSEWVFDAASEGCWKVKDVEYPTQVTLRAFRSLYPHKIITLDSTGAAKKVAETGLWLTSSSRVTVFGSTFQPSTNERIVNVDGQQLINTYAPQMYPEGLPDMAQVKQFEDFLDYLIPESDERDYFLDWVAAKIQNVGFRGNALVMVAKVQGVGRTTLADMLAVLFGIRNVVTMPYEVVVGDNNFNAWMESPLVIVNETKNMSNISPYAAYERLKEIVDPRPKKTLINPKYGVQRYSMIHSSYLFFTNHDNGLTIPDTDRRFYVLTNPSEAETPEYFDTLNAWLDQRYSTETGDLRAWAVHVWRWLMARDVDVVSMLSPAPLTYAKQTMLDESKPTLEVFVSVLIKVWPTEYITFGTVKKLADQFSYASGIDHVDDGTNLLRKLFNDRTRAYPTFARITYEGKHHRPRLIVSHANSKTIYPPTRVNDTFERLELREFKDTVMATLIKTSSKKWLKKFNEALEDAEL